MRTLFSILKKPVLYIPFGLVVIVSGWFLLKPSESDARYEFATVELHDVRQTVLVTGRVEPEDEAELSFERSGRVASVPVSSGDAVLAGQVLISLDADTLRTELLQASAARAAAEAQYAELLRGARPEELAVKDARVGDAIIGLEEAEVALRNALTDAYTTADDAIRNKTDILFENPRTPYPSLVFLSSLKEQIEFKRAHLESRLVEWSMLSPLGVSGSELIVRAEASGTRLREVKEFLDLVAQATNDLTVGSLSGTTIEGYKANGAAARASINAEISALSLATGTVRARASAKNVAERERALAEAGASEETLRAEGARVADARAREEGKQTELRKTVLRAPFSGTVSHVSGTVGGFLGAGTPAVTLISTAHFKIEAYVPEADISKVSVGEQAEITLDAYGATRAFPARVSSLEPAATMFEGVPAYKTVLHFEGDTEGVRAGMTADIEIETDFRAQVLALPQRAVETRPPAQAGVRREHVRILHGDGEIAELPVTTGLRGSDGLVEILSGLKAGASVITFERELPLKRSSFFSH